MINAGKKNLIGVLVDAVDYETVVARVINSALIRQGLVVSPLAVHGVMTGVLDKQHRYRLNHLDMVVPDGQPVRWALNILYGAAMPDRVYGPTLTLKVCERAAKEGLPIYLYGNREIILQRLETNLRTWFPDLVIAGTEASRFRKITAQEKKEIIARIKASGARIIFVGLGCPRQEVWAYEYKEALSMPIVVVGAAFDFHSGAMPQAPLRFQRWGMEWFYRLLHEPRRLWKRYILLNPIYVAMVLLQMLGLKKFDCNHAVPPSQELYYG
jgi:exopolysaccharide biosynthesis WecB/TagA/CpsF family protein